MFHCKISREGKLLSLCEVVEGVRCDMFKVTDVVFVWER